MIRQSIIQNLPHWLPPPLKWGDPSARRWSPTARMFRLALISLSCHVPHLAQVHSLIRKPALPFGLLDISPQHEQVWAKEIFVSNSLIVFSLSAIVFFADSRSDCVLSKVCDSSLLLFSSCVMMWVGVFMRLITHRIAQIWFFWCGWYECTRQVLKSP